MCQVRKGPRRAGRSDCGLTTRPDARQTNSSPCVIRPKGPCDTADVRVQAAKAPVQRRTAPLSEIRFQLSSDPNGEPPGPVPAERQLCEQLGVARTSVRRSHPGLTASGSPNHGTVPWSRAPAGDRPTGDCNLTTQGAGRIAVRGPTHDRTHDVEPRRRATTEERRHRRLHDPPAPTSSARSTERSTPRLPFSAATVPGGLRQDPRCAVRLRRARPCATEINRRSRRHRLVHRPSSDRRGGRGGPKSAINGAGPPDDVERRMIDDCCDN